MHASANGGKQNRRWGICMCLLSIDLSANHVHASVRAESQRMRSQPVCLHDQQGPHTEHCMSQGRMAYFIFRKRVPRGNSPWQNAGVLLQTLRS
jgi:hypothetical protein